MRILGIDPGYATIGVLAPVLVLLGRLLQGFSAGVELGGVSVYLSEIATKGHKGFYTSWQSGSQQVAVVFAALVGVLLNRALPAEEMKNKAAAYGLKGNYYPTVKVALQAAKTDAGSDDFIFIGGSCFVVADLLQELQ